VADEILAPVHQSTPLKAEATPDLVEDETEKELSAVSVHQAKPGRPRLHRRQQSLFLPAVTRRSQVSLKKKKKKKKKYFKHTYRYVGSLMCLNVGYRYRCLFSY
jgi:hypothetical protein